jgi:hypothetical protein
MPRAPAERLNVREEEDEDEVSAAIDRILSQKKRSDRT